MSVPGNGSSTTQNFSLTSIGPTTGTLQGTVTNSSSSLPISGATISIGGTSQATTASDGTYSFTIAGGNYSVTASAAGYTDSTVNGVIVTNGGTTTQDFALTPSGGGSATAPDQPDPPVASIGKGKGTSVSWTAPFDGGSAITGYTLNRYTGSSCATFETSFSSTSTSYRDTSTTRNQTYCYSVIATNAVGDSPESGKSNAVVPKK